MKMLIWGGRDGGRRVPWRSPGAPRPGGRTRARGWRAPRRARARAPQRAWRQAVRQSVTARCFPGLFPPKAPRESRMMENLGLQINNFLKVFTKSSYASASASTAFSPWCTHLFVHSVSRSPP